ncbi:ATP-binding cassette domain-containing protein [Sediminispirochaeta smaragdinae]|uniref:ABC transporter related protein n=1 Tax=Sediminispirochaeta smaragdinae (strain DSM 11293 / JCM 15392 / SEBR 4228) TaxID=573413 RepID=E1R9I3_SEDSS|nr:ATP-binding cassette domain-containing protein [Sediminispirochaeta smaragdinae]ADK83152.1 ABC transporter related protein [Sediminispirochaeta smaragdinae DSM 11293]
MSEYILEVQNVTKDFPGVRALDQVSFSVQKGEIHCLCGENGAGKSTLMGVVSGVYPKGGYEGKVFMHGKETSFRSIRDSERVGLTIVHQDLSLSPYLSIYENIFLGHAKTKMGIVDWNQMLVESVPLLEKVGLTEKPETIVSKMGVGKQQLVEIARALSKQTELLILDEPTSSLNDDESENLLDLILELKKGGLTCIMISHKLDEVLKIADSITVLRDGKSIRSYDTRQEKVDKSMIIKDMVGRDMTHLYPPKTPNIGNVVFEVKNWTVYHPEYHALKVVDNASFFLRKGEILAFCGPMGAGRTELMMSIFGKSYGSSCEGELFINGESHDFSSPHEAIRHGLGYVSEDRKDLGLILIQDVKTNISNSSLNKLSKLGIVNNFEEIHAAERYRKSLNIKTPTIMQLVRNLSGGNQQKVVLSRCLLADPEIFIVDEPTRGIDVGAKYEIYTILNTLASQGKSIIMVSSEMPEAIGMADRIYVMNEGQIKGVLDRSEATQEKIMHMALEN